MPERGRLEPVTREFIALAANASATLMYEPAIREHLRKAIGLGATREQLVEVLELASVVGVHTVTMGLPILAEELASNGTPIEVELTERQQQVKDAYIEERDAWAPFCEPWVRLDPDLMEAYGDYSMIPWKRGEIPPRSRSSFTSRSTPSPRISTRPGRVCTSAKRSHSVPRARRSPRSLPS